MTKIKIQWLGAEWDAETICTPQGVPYCNQIYGYPVMPGSARLNNWVPLSDSGPTSALSIQPTKTAVAASGTISIDVTLDPADGDDVVTVNWATADGTAIAGTHYTASSGTLTYVPGDVFEQIDIPILASGILSPVVFTVVLSSPSNATIAVGVCTVTIQPDSGST